MPVRKKQSEDKEKLFETWKGSNEFKQIEHFNDCRERNTEAAQIEMSNVDINTDWTELLIEFFKLKEAMGVKGCRAKSYEPSVVRTMFFMKIQDEQKRFHIDGKQYTISNAADIDHFNCKTKIYEILDQKIKERDLAPTTFQSWKKDLSKAIKEFDKMYVKHAKSTNPELMKIINEAMNPLTNLIKSNRDYYNLREMLKKDKGVPDFRFEALEEKFIEDLTKICEILRDFGDLKDPFDIKQMLSILKTPNWENIVPLQYYLKPLDSAIDAVVTELLKMFKGGPLQCHYFIEKNKELMKLICDMVRKDVSAQWLAGNNLKQDQFKFMYSCQKIIYNSALKDYLVADKKKSFRILNDILPMLIAYNSLLNVRDIDDKKESDVVKGKQKAERRAALYGDDKEEENKYEEAENIAIKHHNQALSGNKNVADPFASEGMKQKAAIEADIKKYGRTWIWEGYVNDDEEHHQQWIQGAQALRKINPHVLEDLEDFILLQGFQRQDDIRHERDIKNRIEKTLLEQRERELYAMDPEDQKNPDINPVLIGQKEDKKRKFINDFRPHTKAWNFNEEVDPTPHVLRVGANPAASYIDGRVEGIVEIITALGIHLRNYKEDSFRRLTLETQEIFKTHEANEQKALEEGKSKAAQ